MGKLPLLEVRTSISGKTDCDLVAVFQDAAKKPLSPKGNYGETVDRLRKADLFSAKLGTFQFLRFGGKDPAENLLLLGLGQSSELTEEKFRVAGGHTWQRCGAEKIKTLVIHVDSFFHTKGDGKGAHSSLSPTRCMRAFAEGMVLNAYHFVRHKSTTATSSDTTQLRLIFLTHEKGLKTQLEREFDQVRAVGEAVNLTRNWSNEPSNFGTPIYYAEEARKLCKEYGLKFKVLTESDAAREKMGLFLGVGRGSARESRFVIVEYNPKSSTSKSSKSPKSSRELKTIALVGKGVTFDSGGISIKPSMRMEEMKHDMTGAATVMGAMILAAQWEVQNRVIGIMAFTENMPSGEAIQPGNVLTARNGKTVEIINTDAEGRLILADALDYAHDYKPDAIVDIATLTGAVSIALGKQCCAILGNEEGLIEAVRRAGEASGERIWQLPLFDEYFDDLKSESADMKNSANDSYGGTIRGAIFLKQFIKKNVHWAHLDIAAMANNVSHFSYFPKRGATGAYVRTLAQFVSDY